MTGLLPGETEPPGCLQGLRFLESERARPPVVIKGGGGVGVFIIRPVKFHGDWSSGSRLPSVQLPLLFLHSLSW